jgi:hypothetical protein
MSLAPDRRRALLTAALDFRQVAPQTSARTGLAAWLDSWTGVREIAAALRTEHQTLTRRVVSSRSGTQSFADACLWLPPKSRLKNRELRSKAYWRPEGWRANADKGVRHRRWLLVRLSSGESGSKTVAIAVTRRSIELNLLDDSEQCLVEAARAGVFS